MDELIDLLNFDSGETFSLVNYITNIVICALLLYLLSIIYEKYGRSLSNRTQLSKVLILVGITTFIIISIVKSSLALSLGLVGALSIIRFRTAIKEPEELGYFFIAIAIGLGLGANQLVPTVLGVVVLFLIIYLSGRKNVKNNVNQNLLVSLNRANKEDFSSIQSNITNIVAEHSVRTELIRLNRAKDTLDLNFLIALDKYDSIDKITKALFDLDDAMSITFIDSQNMTI